MQLSAKSLAARTPVQRAAGCGGPPIFVNDLNGRLYLLDKQTKAFTKYLDFNGLDGRQGLVPKFTDARNFATWFTKVILDPDYARNGVFYTLHMEDPSTPPLSYDDDYDETTGAIV